jgi:hypothetical protein
MLKEILMQHFFYGLKPESAHFMNVASEGSVMHKIEAEVRTLLEKVLNSTDYPSIYDDPPEPIKQPSETQQLQILSAASSPPPPYIEEITEPPKSPDHEPLIEDMPMFIPDLFTEEEYLELGNAASMPKEDKCICSRSEVFIPEASSQVEGFSAIIRNGQRKPRLAVALFRSTAILECSSALLGMLNHKKLFMTRRLG